MKVNVGGEGIKASQLDTMHYDLSVNLGEVRSHGQEQDFNERRHPLSARVVCEG